MKVSIVMPVYNVQDYLDQAILSVLEQKYKDFELILINDGSTDSSGLIAEYWADRDNRIKLIHQNNRGLSGARNTGIDHSSGEYITFIDSDDYCSPDFLGRLVEIKEKYNADVVISSHVKFRQGDTPKSFSKGVREYTGRKYVIDIFGPKVIGAYAWGKLFNRACFDTIRFPEGRLYEDMFTIPYAIYDLSRIIYLNEGLYYYRQRAGSIMSKFTYQRSDEIYAISAIIDFAQQKHDRLLCWYASINHIRSWIEIKHRFKKNGLDFMPIYDDMQHKVRDSMRFAVFPFF